MTTATTVAGRTLSGWSRDGRHGTWYALLPTRPGEPLLGALRIDRGLIAPQGTPERLAAAVLAVAKLRLPGVLGTVDLVVEAGEVWLITARPPAPTLADLLADGAAGLDAGSAASILNETAQTLLALHNGGLVHGTLHQDTVVLAPDGVALLAEATLGTVLGDTSDSARRDADSARREADAAAWAGLAGILGAAWTVPGSPAAGLFARCSALAGTEGLASARAALVAGRAALPADLLQRTALRAAVAALTPDLTAAPTADESPDETTPPSTARHDQAPLLGERDGDRTPDRARTPARPHHTPHRAPTASDRALRTPHPAPRPAKEAPAPAPALAPAPRSPREVPAPAPVPDDQPTVLGRRNRTSSRPAAARSAATAGAEFEAEPGAEPGAVPTVAGTVAPGGAVVGGDILLRFGPGIPADAHDTLRAQWRTEPPPPGTRPRPRGRRAWIATTAFLTVAAVLLWLLLRPAPAPTVTAVAVEAPAGRLSCGQTADLVGVMTTDGGGGPVTYHWLRSDGHDSGELVRMVHRGDRRVTVHLRWTVRGPGRFRGAARLLIEDRRKPVEAGAAFSYVCP
ncbi:hypothetical protein JK359_17495 [Streptomyces actinomycinicus]|uniref:Uncharacterized protein n=1 Tax=Streptomyces actinomycinicus TaxID=1695166 RepID=A0A937JMQ1_9ACTN|nr:hypothetical protein [Streptomyces actinomycinicus]MBL1083740.1 hypothetical protein [Streptomyces actinomycinicus]